MVNCKTKQETWYDHKCAWMTNTHYYSTWIVETLIERLTFEWNEKKFARQTPPHGLYGLDKPPFEEGKP